MFVCLRHKQFNHFSSVFWQTHLVPCCLQELWIYYDTKRFSFSPTLMLLTVIALYSVFLFVCLKVKISRGKLRARIFSGGFLHLFKTSRVLCFKGPLDNQCPLRAFVVVIIREIVSSAHKSVSEKCVREEREDRRKIFRYITLDTCTV